MVPLFGIVLTSVYMIGMALNAKKRYYGMGIDSWLALLIYLIGIAGLMWVT